MTNEKFFEGIEKFFFRNRKLSDEERSAMIIRIFAEQCEGEKQIAMKRALALWLAKFTREPKQEGMSWSAYVVDRACMTTRQARKYLRAVDLWLLKLDYPLDLFTKIHVSCLGEIAQKGVVGSKEEAEEWLQKARILDSADLRDELMKAAGGVSSAERRLAGYRKRAATCALHGINRIKRELGLRLTADKSEKLFEILREQILSALAGA